MRTTALALVSLLMTGAVYAQEKHNIVTGTVSKIDGAAKTTAVKTAEGSEVVLKETDKTLKSGAAGVKDGSLVIANYTTSGATHTAVAIKHVSGKTVHVAEGTADKVDAAAKTVAVKTKDGSVVVFNEAADGVMHTGGALKQGAHVTVHYTDDAGKKVAHAIHSAL